MKRRCHQQGEHAVAGAAAAAAVAVAVAAARARTGLALALQQQQEAERDARTAGAEAATVVAQAAEAQLAAAVAKSRAAQFNEERGARRGLLQQRGQRWTQVVMRAHGAAGALGNPFVLPPGAAGERFRWAVCEAHEMLVREALRAPASASAERIAARAWRLADGTESTLQVDDRYTRARRPNLGEEIRSAVGALVEQVRREQTLLLCACATGLRCHSEGLARVVNEQAVRLDGAAGRRGGGGARAAAGSGGAGGGEAWGSAGDSGGGAAVAGAGRACGAQGVTACGRRERGRGEAG